MSAHDSEVSQCCGVTIIGTRIRGFPVCPDLLALAEHLLNRNPKQETYTCKGVPDSHHSSLPGASPPVLPIGKGHSAGGFRRVVRNADGWARGSSHGDGAAGGTGAGEGFFSSFASGFSGGLEEEEEEGFKGPAGGGEEAARWFQISMKLRY